MASLELRNETFRVVFMHGGQKHGYSLGTGDKKTAEQLVKGVETTLWELDQGYRQLPDGIDIVDFVRKGGKADLPEAETLPQERVDEWVSHQTEEQRKRYRHLFPDQQQQAIASVFGA